MKTIDQIRLDNLKLLVAEFGTAEVVAEKSSTSPVYLSQIRNGAVDIKTKKVRQVGDPLARKLEAGCGKERGWMDHPHDHVTYRNERIIHAAKVMENMNDWQVDQAIKILDTLAQRAPDNGTGP